MHLTLAMPGLCLSALLTVLMVSLILYQLQPEVHFIVYLKLIKIHLRILSRQHAWCDLWTPDAAGWLGTRYPH